MPKQNASVIALEILLVVIALMAIGWAARLWKQSIDWINLNRRMMTLGNMHDQKLPSTARVAAGALILIDLFRLIS